MVKDPRTDEIAKEAARLVGDSVSMNIAAAISKAAQILNYEDAPKPGWGRVRKHLQAQTMQFQGKEEYQQSIINLWECAESMMTSLTLAFNDAEIYLVGRAAEGQIDGGLQAYIRIYTSHSITTLTQVLVELGCEEIEYKTFDTLHGRLNAMHIVESPWEFVLIRCPLDLHANRKRNLFTGKEIKIVSLVQLRKMIENSR